MPQFKLEFNKIFRDQLREIKGYLLKHRDRTETVERFLRHVASRIAQLKDFPQLGKVCEYNPKFRRILVDEYVIFYRAMMREKVIRIEFIFHGTQNLPIILRESGEVG